MNVLALNCGSSSVKFKLVSVPAGGIRARDARAMAQGLIEEIGSPRAAFTYETGEGRGVAESLPVPDHEAAVRALLDALVDSGRGVLDNLTGVHAVGHRVVHGGARFREPTLIDEEVLRAIDACSPLAPLHNPHNLRGIEIASELLPEVPEVAVFDTAFHQSMPSEASTYALPEKLRSERCFRRYGFHGISHRFVAEAAAAELSRPLEELRLVTCHLGNGASVAAVRGGKSVDTSMGMTPLEGLVMGTRCGDLDPAIVLRLIRDLGMTPQEADRVLNEESGLLGLSGLSNDMRAVLEASAAGDERADLAVRVFCYRVRKYVGAYSAVLGGLDALVFTGGIGENEPLVRAGICEGLGFLGVRLDDSANGRGASRIGSGRAEVLVIETDEELAIALETARLPASAS